MSIDHTACGVQQSMFDKCCAQCGERKIDEEFPGDKARPDGLHPYCRECVCANSRDYYRRNKEKVLTRTTKWAKENPEIKRRSVAKWRKANPDAVRADKRSYHHAHKEELKSGMRDRSFRSRFGISAAERDAMAAEVRHCCQICGIKESDCVRRHALDHDHKTGLIRGILCAPCNMGLGHFADDLNRLEAAASYLRDHATKEATHDHQDIQQCHDQRR